MERISLTNQAFGRLTAINFAYSKNGRAFWHCKCKQKWAYENGYTGKLTIDRIDNNGNYCPENCRRVDILTQENNKRNNARLTYKDKTQTMAQWAREIGMKYNTLDERLRKGWSVEAAITTPVMCKRG